MAISKIFKPLLHEVSKVGSHIQGVAIQRLMAATNALYEATFDDSAVGAGAQTIQGHNHHDTGGGPLPRGLSWSEDLGFNPIFSDEFTSTSYETFWDWNNHCRYLVSAGMDASLALEGWLFYSAQNTDFEITFTETFSKASKKTGYSTLLEKTHNGNEAQAWKWKNIFVPLGPNAVNGLTMGIRAKSVEEDHASTLSIYSFQISEVAGVSYKMRENKI